jgi:hypothetical protein
MVHEQIAQCTLGLSRSWRKHAHFGKRSNKQLLKKAEVEHKKFDGDRVCASRHVHAEDVMVIVLHIEPRVQAEVHEVISRHY